MEDWENMMSKSTISCSMLELDNMKVSTNILRELNVVSILYRRDTINIVELCFSNTREYIAQDWQVSLRKVCRKYLSIYTNPANWAFFDAYKMGINLWFWFGKNKVFVQTILSIQYMTRVFG